MCGVWGVWWGLYELVSRPDLAELQSRGASSRNSKQLLMRAHPELFEK